MSSSGERDLLDFVIILYIGLIVVLAVAIYIELKYMRPKRREDIELALTKDDAFNMISSTTAVSGSLKGMGKNTTSADALLVKAQAEYDRNDYIKASATAKAARDLLSNASDEKLFQEPPNPHDVDAIEGDGSEEKKEDKTVHEAKKLPPNYLESKFLIETTKEELARAKDTGNDVTRSETHLAEAERCFGTEDYGGAFRSCMKARRSLAGKPEEISGQGKTVVSELSSMDLESAENVEPSAPEVQVKGAAAGFVEGRCPVCNAPMNKDDNFCPKCGNKVVRERKCKKCGSPIAGDDVFCRKCGEKQG